jgi:hypothetical protein
VKHFAFAFLCICTPMWSQSLQILPAPPSGNNGGLFQVMIVTPKASPVASVQWSITMSDGFTVDAQEIKTGAAAEEAKKSLTCAVTGKQAAARKLVCILAGGVRSISDGAIATVRFTGAAGVRAATVSISDGMGATAEGKPISYTGGEATLPQSARPTAK